MDESLGAAAPVLTIVRTDLTGCSPHDYVAAGGGGDVLGWWEPDSRRIVVDAGSTRRQQAETIVHELLHAFLGHGADVDPDEHAWVEDTATRWLRDLDDRVEQLRDGVLQHDRLRR